MKSAVLRLALGIALVGGVSSSALFAAEEAPKALPTLLIKGEVVSLDSSDPSAPLLKVKDRYGFETPIFLTPEAKISQGEAALNASNLTAGTQVEVEYNFDVNTAKRHAVSVKVATPTPPTTSASAAVPAPAAPAAVPAVQPAVAPPAPAAAPATAPATPAPKQEEKAPAIQ